MSNAPLLLAIDGGGSKTDALAVELDGRIAAWERGAGCNPQTMGWPAVRGTLDRLRAAVELRVLRRPIRSAHVYLAGLDLPAELDEAKHELGHWGQGGSGPAVIDNDLFALLRTGTDAGDAVAVVCGTGINALGVRQHHAAARFPALGEISGDWGGGAALGSLALWHAVRAEDGRGPETELRRAVPAAFGLRFVREVSEGVHFGRISASDVVALAPLLFTVAEAGDPVAASVVDRQAEEIVLLAGVALSRLGLEHASVPVVLGGSVLAARQPRLEAAIRAGLAARAPRARPVWVSAPPVLGAALLALEHAGAGQDALARLTHELGTAAAAL